jgi:urea transport system substrate-binding protein
VRGAEEDDLNRTMRNRSEGYKPMAPTTPSCPESEKLAALQANALSSAEAEELRRHIAACPACQAKLSRAETNARRADAPGDSSSQTVAYPAPSANSDNTRSSISFSFLRPASGPDELGRLGDYRILRVIGSGGMGIVLEAEDVALGRRVALKVLRPDLADEEYRQRFLREARAAASLPHEHIVTIYQVGEDNGVPFLAMEYLKGQSLESRLQKDGWLPLVDALDITRQTAEGLAVAHENGLIHRDVKPDNLWIESGISGPAGRVKLLDFGLARPAHGPSDLTAPGQVVGTPGYMAPEVVYGQPVDARADLYSLGCVLYRMLTGKTPFAEDGLDTRALLHAAAERDVISPESPARDLPPPVLELLRNLLARNPEQRPPDCHAVLARLRDIARESAVPPASQPSLIHGPGKGQPRNALRFGVWTGALTVLLALLVGGAVFLQRVLAPALANPGDEAEGAATVASGEPLRVGLLYSNSGTLRYSEKSVRDATLQAIREINAAGGVKIGGSSGRPIESVTVDGLSNEDDFARGAEKLFSQDGVACLFGCWTSSSRKGVEEVCARHKRLLVYAVPDEGLEQSQYVFYLGGTPNQLMNPTVRWLYSDLGKRRFFLAGSEYVFSAATHVILRHEVEKLGGQVVGDRLRPLGTVDFNEMAEEIAKARADVILCTIDGTSNWAFAQALRSGKLRPPTVPTVWFNVGENELHFMNDAKESMPGDYAPFCYFQSFDFPQNVSFLKRLRSAYHDPTMPVTDPMETSYSSVYLWKQAVEAAGTMETDAVREAFRKQSFDAPEGTIRIDPATQRAWRTPRVGRVNERLDFDVVWAAPKPIEPLPYPNFRSRDEWDQFLQEKYKEWGGHWEVHAR